MLMDPHSLMGPPQLPYTTGWTHCPLPVRPRVTQPVRGHGWPGCVPALGGQMFRKQTMQAIPRPTAGLEGEEQGEAGRWTRREQERDPPLGAGRMRRVCGLGGGVGSSRKWGQLVQRS